MKDLITRKDCGDTVANYACNKAVVDKPELGMLISVRLDDPWVVFFSGFQQYTKSFILYFCISNPITDCYEKLPQIVFIYLYVQNVILEKAGNANIYTISVWVHLYSSEFMKVRVVKLKRNSQVEKPNEQSSMGVHVQADEKFTSSKTKCTVLNRCEYSS